jgi:very-short-patch-repair endonuclease
MIQNLWPFIAILIVFVIAITALKAFLGSNKGGTEDYPYEKEQTLFTPAERSFLGVLDQAVDNKLRIMSKVRLADIIKVKNGNNKSAWQKAFNRIQSKHVDFVACDTATLGVKFVVELDDKSHNQSKRRDRDEFIDKALAAAKIPVFHFEAKRTYTIQELQNVLFGNKSETAKLYITN